jgi:hypothetical protein
MCQTCWGNLLCSCKETTRKGKEKEDEERQRERKERNKGRLTFVPFGMRWLLLPSTTVWGNMSAMRRQVHFTASLSLAVHNYPKSWLAVRYVHQALSTGNMQQFVSSANNVSFCSHKCERHQTAIKHASFKTKSKLKDVGLLTREPLRYRHAEYRHKPVLICRPRNTSFKSRYVVIQALDENKYFYVYRTGQWVTRLKNNLKKYCRRKTTKHPTKTLWSERNRY